MKFRLFGFQMQSIWEIIIFLSILSDIICNPEITSTIKPAETSTSKTSATVSSTTLSGGSSEPIVTTDLEFVDWLLKPDNLNSSNPLPGNFKDKYKLKEAMKKADQLLENDIYFETTSQDKISTKKFVMTKSSAANSYQIKSKTITKTKDEESQKISNEKTDEPEKKNSKKTVELKGIPLKPKEVENAKKEIEDFKKKDSNIENNKPVENDDESSSPSVKPKSLDVINSPGSTAELITTESTDSIADGLSENETLINFDIDEIQSVLPPFKWTLDSAENVLRMDYYDDISDLTYEEGKKRRATMKMINQFGHPVSNQMPLRVLPANMQAILIALTKRRVPISVIIMLMIPWLLILLSVCSITGLAARKKRLKKYNRKLIFTMIIAARLKNKQHGNADESKLTEEIDLEPNLYSDVLLQRSNFSPSIFQNLRSAIQRYAEFMDMVYQWENIKASNDKQKMVIATDLFIDFFKRERAINAKKTKKTNSKNEHSLEKRK